MRRSCIATLAIATRASRTLKAIYASGSLPYIMQKLHTRCYLCNHVPSFLYSEMYDHPASVAGGKRGSRSWLLIVCFGLRHASLCAFFIRPNAPPKIEHHSREKGSGAFAVAFRSHTRRTRCGKRMNRQRGVDSLQHMHSAVGILAMSL